MNRTTHNPVVCLISLGCSKNTVDSECILGNLAADGILIAENPRDADVCLVNTCGFIQDAREEAAGVFEELHAQRRKGKPGALVALGCLVERIADFPEMNDFLRHANAKVGFQDYARLPEICRALAAPSGARAVRRVHRHGATYRAPETFMRFLHSPRARIGSPHTAYLKISEGCSNMCRFCSIPRIRGLQVSRPLEELVGEAKELVQSGAREINLIAQDTTSYGKDLYGEYRLATLLRELKSVDPHVWYRMLYAYPRYLSDDVLDALATEPHLCPYLDLPLQHISDRVLKDMGRGMSRDKTLRLLDKIAGKLPRGALRTTFIAGYPGETDSEFNELLDFVKEGRFTHLGVFTYSREPGTPAAKQDDDVPLEVKKERRNELMLAQLHVSRERLKRMTGETVEVMLDGLLEDEAEVPPGSVAFGRTRLDAADVDGMVFLRGETDGAMPGEILKAEVTEGLDYDLVADITP